MCKSLVSNGKHIAEGSSRNDLKKVLYKVCDSVVKGSLTTDQVQPVLGDVIVSIELSLKMHRMYKVIQNF